ncbi:MAG: hypothetical protein DCF30_20305 [Hyphomicrobiales bacterium]|nr:MAG: hypothetical protein DCF30_20305 [Hyphomicrobiales bacterium]
MPHYKITTDDGAGFQGANDSIEFSDTKAATDDAQVALAEMAREKLPNGKRASFGVQVENEAGKSVYRADLEFSAHSEADIEREEGEADVAAQDVAATLWAGPLD